MSKRNRQLKPHEEDAQMDVLNLVGLESRKELSMRVRVAVDKKTGAAVYRGKVSAAQMLGLAPLPSPK